MEDRKIVNVDRRTGMSTAAPIVIAGDQMRERNAKQSALRRAEEDQRRRQEYQSTAAVTPVPTEPGRNEPCPCASGRKFKRCCSQDAPAVHNEERQRRKAYVKALFEEKSKVPENETEQQRSQRVRALALIGAYLAMT